MVSPAERFYFIRNRLVARGPNRGYGSHSLILTCPCCGTANWGSILLARGSDGNPVPYRSYDYPCEYCPHGPSPWYPAGSFLPAARTYAAGMAEGFDWENIFPAEIIEREARLHLAYPIK